MPAREPRLSVYVHDLIAWGRVRGGGRNMRWTHMIADTLDELHAMAAAIGMKRAWFQGPPKHRDAHYDLTPRRRAAAVHLGAIECDRRTFVSHMRRLRGLPPRPGTP